MKLNGSVSLLNVLHKRYCKATIKDSELILIPFSPFDITHKTLNVKNLWKCIFRASKESKFFILSPNHGGCSYLLEFL